MLRSYSLLSDYLSHLLMVWAGLWVHMQVRVRGGMFTSGFSEIGLVGRGNDNYGCVLYRTLTVPVITVYRRLAGARCLPFTVPLYYVVSLARVGSKVGRPPRTDVPRLCRVWHSQWFPRGI